jgi:hypothetical protein
LRAALKDVVAKLEALALSASCNADRLRLFYVEQ